jgi:hypothetical protein
MMRTLAMILVWLTAAAAAAKPPSWDTKIEGAKRFKVLKAFADQAVLDRETGLVWQRTPRTDGVTFENAYATCLRDKIGGRSGWRLPRLDELLSMVDLDVHAVAAGHPFELGPPLGFWTATASLTNAGADAGKTWAFHPGLTVGEPQKTDLLRGWCVRGGVSGGAL